MAWSIRCFDVFKSLPLTICSISVFPFAVLILKVHRVAALMLLRYTVDNLYNVKIVHDFNCRLRPSYRVAALSAVKNIAIRIYFSTATARAPCRVEEESSRRG